MKILIRMIALVVIAGLAVPAVAEEFSAPAGKRPWNLGAGAVHREKAYDGFKDSKKTTPIPIILFEGERFFVRGSNLGWKFINTNPWEVSILAEWWADGYEDGDASILRGMSDRDPSLAVGGQVRWQPQRFGLELTATTDAMSNSDGTQVRAMAKFDDRSGPWFYSLSGGIVYSDSDFNDYYYGVSTREVDLTRGRTSYSADDETGIRLGGLLGYNASGSKWTFLGGARYDYLGDEVDNSSITENDYQYALFGGFTYAFGK